MALPLTVVVDPRQDGSDCVDIDTFINGTLRLKGDAKSFLAIGPLQSYATAKAAE